MDAVTHACTTRWDDVGPAARRISLGTIVFEIVRSYDRCARARDCTVRGDSAARIPEIFLLCAAGFHSMAVFSILPLFVRACLVASLGVGVALPSLLSRHTAFCSSLQNNNNPGLLLQTVYLPPSPTLRARTAHSLRSSSLAKEKRKKKKEQNNEVGWANYIAASRSRSEHECHLALWTRGCNTPPRPGSG